MKTQVLNNKVTFISIAIFILLSLGTIGFLWNQNQQLKKMILSYQQTNQVRPTPIVTTDPINNWKIYTDLVLRFELKYPEFLTKYESDVPLSNNKFDHIFSLSDKSVNIKNHQDAIQIRRISINEVKLNSYYKFNKVDLILGNNQFTIYEPPVEDTILIIIYLLKIDDKNYFEIQVPRDKKQRELSNQILSTFKFLDASPTPISKVCTMEAKICPDGSSVGRSGPNCEFSPCPTP